MFVLRSCSTNSVSEAFCTQLFNELEGLLQLRGELRGVHDEGIIRIASHKKRGELKNLVFFSSRRIVACRGYATWYRLRRWTLPKSTPPRIMASVVPSISTLLRLLAGWYLEASTLQPFCPHDQSVTIPIEDLASMLPAVEEDKVIARHHVLAHGLSHQSVQSVKLLPHVGGTRVDEDADGWRQTKHDAPRSWKWPCRRVTAARSAVRPDSVAADGLPRLRPRRSQSRDLPAAWPTELARRDSHLAEPVVFPCGPWLCLPRCAVDAAPGTAMPPAVSVSNHRNLRSRRLPAHRTAPR